MTVKISTKPYIGTKDYIGKDLDLLYYIFNKWRNLALSYNYQEYINPIIEYSLLYKAKSGEDLGDKELYEFTDKSGRKIAIKPEATPSVARLVSSFYNTTPKPIRLFSIQKFMRYEKPQKGRYREFWQLNIDIFGDNSEVSDFEILKIAAESILVFNPPKGSFIIYVNSRPLMDIVLKELLRKIYTRTKKELYKVIDKYTKLEKEAFKKELLKIGLQTKMTNKITTLLEVDLNNLTKLIPSVKDTKEYLRLKRIFKMLKQAGLSDYFKYNPAIVRGIDYYDGIVFEAFDLNSENSRSLFGGGRYNGLGYLFGIKDMPAVGFAPGNATMEIFLKNWRLIPEDIRPSVKVFLPQLIEEKTIEYYKTADWLKINLSKLIKFNTNKIISVEVSIKPMTIKKSLKYALAKEFDFIALIGEDEIRKEEIVIKDLKKRNQNKIKVPKVLKKFLRLNKDN